MIEANGRMVNLLILMAEHERFYTNGSRKEDSAGIYVYGLSFKYHKTLGTTVSIFQV